MPTRRSFLRSLGALATGAALLPEQVLADPYGVARIRRAARDVVRVRGRVTGGGRGLGGVRVTDGYDVVRTGSDGNFELVTHEDRRFVSICTPGGWRIERRANGTAGHFRSIQANAAA